MKASKRFFFLLIALMMFIFSGCQFVKVNEERDNAQVIMDINGTKILKSQVVARINTAILQEQYNRMFSGQSTDPSLAGIDSIVNSSMIISQVEQSISNRELLYQLAVEAGQDKLSAEDEKACKDQYDAEIENYETTYKQQAIDSIIAQKAAEEEAAKVSDEATATDGVAEETVSPDVSETPTPTLAPGQTPEPTPTPVPTPTPAPEVIAEAEKQVETYKQDYLTLRGLTSMDQLLDDIRKDKIVEKYSEYIKAQKQVTAEDFQKWYDSTAESQKGTFEESPKYFYEYTNSESTVACYAPKGYRYVKQILINLTEEGKKKISDLPEDATEEQKAAAKEEAFAEIKPKAEEALAKVKKGDDFEALIDEYNEDPGMQKDAETRKTGYLASEAMKESDPYTAGFLDACLALNKVGATSELIATDFGYHILLYSSDVPEGKIPYEQVKTKLEAQVTQSNQTSYYMQFINDKTGEWEKAGKLKLYLNRIDPDKFQQ